MCFPAGGSNEPPCSNIAACVTHVYVKYNISRNRNYGSLRLPIIRKNVTLNH